MISASWTELKSRAATCFNLPPNPHLPGLSPPVMAKRPVSLCHLMGVFFPFYSRPLSLVSLSDFISQFFYHALAFFLPCKIPKPSHGYGRASVFFHFHRHLIGCAANPPGFDL